MDTRLTNKEDHLAMSGVTSDEHRVLVEDYLYDKLCIEMFNDWMRSHQAHIDAGSREYIAMQAAWIEAWRIQQERINKLKKEIEELKTSLQK